MTEERLGQASMSCRFRLAAHLASRDFFQPSKLQIRTTLSTSSPKVPSYQKISFKMFTLRNASRLAVKAARFSTSTSTRSISTKLPAFRQVNVASKRTAFAPRFTAAFNSSARQQAQSEVDVELVAKLESELELEKEMKDYDDYPISVKDYLESGPFKVCR